MAPQYWKALDSFLGISPEHSDGWCVPRNVYLFCYWPEECRFDGFRSAYLYIFRRNRYSILSILPLYSLSEVRIQPDKIQKWQKHSHQDSLQKVARFGVLSRLSANLRIR